MFRVLFIVFVALSIVYLSLSLFFRSREIARLKEEWETGPQDFPEGDFVKAGLVRFEQQLRRKLIWTVYVIPLALVALLIYLTNFA